MSGSTERSAVVLRIAPGREADYRAWLDERSADALADVHARHGIRAQTVLTAGRRLIVHYEADGKECVPSAFVDPAWAALLEGELAGVLEMGDGAPALHEEIFTWSMPAPGPWERAGLLLSVRPGQEAAYREWLASDAIEELATIWTRNDIYRHDVLAAGTSVVAYYECRSRFNVLKAFREPEALIMLLGQLAPILELDPHTPMSLFEEVSSWRAVDERQPA